MKKVFALFLMLFPVLGISQNVIPQPSLIVARDGAFDLKTATNISYNDPSLARQADFLNNQIFKLTNIKLHRVNGAHPSIVLVLKLNALKPTGSYHLEVSGSNIILTAN